MKKLIALKLDEIAHCICSKLSRENNTHVGGLYDGAFGVLLFLNYFLRYSQDTKTSIIVDIYAEKLVQNLDKNINNHTYSGGFAGVLYLFEFLRKQEFIDIDIQDVEYRLEDYLFKSMNEDLLNNNYDFLHGAIGVGFYFLKKNNANKPILKLIDFLYDTANKDFDNKIFKWKSLLDINTRNCRMGYNISLSHGMSCIVIFLSRVIDNKIESEKLSVMLTCSVNYLLSQIIENQDLGSFFPHYSREDINTSLSKSRLAWCYGDLGVAFAIWKAGCVTNNLTWQNKALSILLSSISRLSCLDNNVYDAGICHGTAGIAMIYRRMYIETNMFEFMNASNYWLNQTLLQSRFSDGLAGYKSFVKDKWLCDYSVLMGISGIGLVFASYLMDDLQNWDELFLLS